MRIQKLARFGFAYAAVLLLVSILGTGVLKFCFPVLFLPLLAGVFFRPLRTNTTFWCVVSAAVFAVSAFFLYTRFVYEPAVSLDGKTGTAELTVSDCVFRSGGYRYEFEMTGFDGGALPPTNLACYTVESLGLDYGDRFLAEVTLEKAAPLSSDSWNDYYRSRELFLEGTLSDEESSPEVLSSKESVGTFFRRLRDSLSASLAEVMPQDGTLDVAEGMLLGGDSDLSALRQLRFSRAGVSHLFAVSGLHMTVVIQLTMLLLSFLRLRRTTRTVLGLCAVLGFVLLTGGAPSVLRSGVMTSLLLFGGFFRRRANGLNSLGIAVLAICLANPYAMYDIGFLLSVTATLGILLFASPLGRFLCRRLRIASKRGEAAVSLFAVSFSAVIGTLPVTLLSFQELSLVGLLFNPVINFLVTAILFSGFAAAFLGLVPFLGGLASLFGAVCSLAVRALEYGAKFASELPFAYLPLGKGMALAVLAAAAVFILTLRFSRKRKGILLPGVLSAVLLLTAASFLVQAKEEQSFSVTAVFPQGKSGILVEAGGVTLVYGAETSGASTLLERELLARGVDTVDYYILSGNGASAVKNARTFSELFQTKRFFVSETVRLTTDGFAGEGEEFLLSNDGISVTEGDLSFTLTGAEDPAVELNFREKRCLIVNDPETAGGFLNKTVDLLVAKTGSPERDLPGAERILLLSSDEEGKDAASSVLFFPEASRAVVKLL